MPIIFISAYGRRGTIARAVEREADDYLGNPFSAAKLTTRVSLLRRMELIDREVADTIAEIQRTIIQAAKARAAVSRICC